MNMQPSLFPHILSIIFGLEFSLANKNDQNEAWRGRIAFSTAKVSVRPILIAATVRESLADEFLHILEASWHDLGDVAFPVTLEVI